MSGRGIFAVAFGEPARACVLRLIASVRRYMPDVPIAVCSSRPLERADHIFVEAPDSDVGARRAKLRAYELAPAEWRSVLYLDADTELVGPAHRLFEWVEGGWDLAITRDVGDTLHSFQRRNNLPELAETRASIGSYYALQFNGGVWAFRRSEAVARLMARWLIEWDLHAQRDQGALLRALWADPVRVLVLDHTWNCFPRYTPHVKDPVILHYPGMARRWVGKLPGRLDSPTAWAIARQWERANGL